eukprot:PhM_4_TR3199/c0_g1_i1/m.8052
MLKKLGFMFESLLGTGHPQTHQKRKVPSLHSNFVLAASRHLGPAALLALRQLRLCLRLFLGDLLLHAHDAVLGVNSERNLTVGVLDEEVALVDLALLLPGQAGVVTLLHDGIAGLHNVVVHAAVEGFLAAAQLQGPGVVHSRGGVELRHEAFVFAFTAVVGLEAAGRPRGAVFLFLAVVVRRWLTVLLLGVLFALLRLGTVGVVVRRWVHEHDLARDVVTQQLQRRTTAVGLVVVPIEATAPRDRVEKDVGDCVAVVDVVLGVEGHVVGSLEHATGDALAHDGARQDEVLHVGDGQHAVADKVLRRGAEGREHQTGAVDEPHAALIRDIERLHVLCLAGRCRDGHLLRAHDGVDGAALAYVGVTHKADGHRAALLAAELQPQRNHDVDKFARPVNARRAEGLALLLGRHRTDTLVARELRLRRRRLLLLLVGERRLLRARHLGARRGTGDNPIRHILDALGLDAPAETTVLADLEVASVRRLGHGLVVREDAIVLAELFLAVLHSR